MNQKVFKQEITGYILLALIISACIYYLAWMLITGKNQDTVTTILTIGFLIYFTIMFYNYAKTKIIVEDSTIVYETLFKRKQAKFGDIIKIETFAKVDGITSHGVHAKYILLLYTNTEKIEIRIKLYSRKNLKDLAQILVNKCSAAEINNQTHMMTEGKMPSAFFRSQ